MCVSFVYWMDTIRSLKTNDILNSVRAIAFGVQRSFIPWFYCYMDSLRSHQTNDIQLMPRFSFWSGGVLSVLSATCTLHYHPLSGPALAFCVQRLFLSVSLPLGISTFISRPTKTNSACGVQLQNVYHFVCEHWFFTITSDQRPWFSSRSSNGRVSRILSATSTLYESSKLTSEK